ncbi:MAG: alcohol dehydrogenase catalytic domain-containing protein [Deltaproteobacteria bacterium]|nr:alcohol dehydrogenase catalytic domain-containing protein [Deltaproteobacteria bacterium]
MYYANNDIRIEHLPVPPVGEGEILVRIRASGVCGSDVMEWYRRDKVPLVLGHEVAGEIVQVGRAVDNFSIGDRVVVAHHVPCMVCEYCQRGRETMCRTLQSTNFDPGGFCEYVLVPAINVKTGTFKIPGHVSDEEASFTEPVACVLRAQRLAGLRPGGNVLVIGSGISGLLHIACAAAQGAGAIVSTDISPYRVEMANKLGAKAHVATQFTPDHVREATGGRLADLIVTTTGAVPAIEQAFACAERGATIVLFAPTGPDVKIPISINDLFWKKDLTVTTSYAGSPADHAQALRMIAAGRIDVKSLITHRLPLAETQKAFQLVVEGGESVKVIVEPQS